MFCRVRYALVLLLGLAACESDKAKLERLHTEQTMQCLLAQRYEANGDPRLRDAPIRCKLAGEKLEAFIAKH